MEIFKYRDIDDNDITLEIDINLLRVVEKATTYNYKWEVVSRNKIVGWWTAQNKKKFFNILRNNIGNMSEETKRNYTEFIEYLVNNNKE